MAKVGAEVRVWWEAEQEFFTGRISSLSEGAATVVYDDGDEEVLSLSQCEVIDSSDRGRGDDRHGALRALCALLSPSDRRFLADYLTNGGDGNGGGDDGGGIGDGVDGGDDDGGGDGGGGGPAVVVARDDGGGDGGGGGGGGVRPRSMRTAAVEAFQRAVQRSTVERTLERIGSTPVVPRDPAPLLTNRAQRAVFRYLARLPMTPHSFRDR